MIPTTNIHTVGRCHSDRCRSTTRTRRGERRVYNRPAFVWPKRLMRLSEARCPRCGRALDQTSRDYRGGFVEITAAEIVPMLEAAIVRHEANADRARDSINAWLADEASSFKVANSERWRQDAVRQAQDVRARLGRARKQAAADAQARAQAVAEAVPTGRRHV